ncbi:MAG TPA: NAD(P)H-hydrate dehydratase, partial [Campylobacterales bacterium]|nr:NAD(P)H-hydrate dehydratase [Campylobacterales bacterium]
ADIIIDAIFGAGLSRELNEATRKIIVQLETLNGFKIACDVPTGIDIDGNPLPMAFIADVTITMGAYKEALYSDMAKDFVGEVICVDLGISYHKYTTGFDTDLYLLEESDMKLPLRDWSKITHKGSFGHLAVVVGQKEGAGILTGSSALSFGAGLVTLVGDIQTSLPLSLMQDIEIPTKTTAIALGMGFGSDFDEDIVDEVLDNEAHLILDADIFSSERVIEFLEQTNREIVLTPHPKEFVSLWNMVIDEPISISLLQANRFNKVREFCSVFPNITLLLKGANMIIAQDNKLWVNPHGTSQLSKGGSGDVLSGLIGGLLAQGWSGIESAIHGSLALTSSAKKYKGNSYAMLPIDLIDNLKGL